MVSRLSLMQKMVQIGASTLLSRLLGLVREVLMANYLGAGALAEAFLTAFKIPNSLRKIFAEGALSVAFIPTFVEGMKKDGQSRVSRLTTLALILFEGFLLLLCIVCVWQAHWVIRLIMPGWFTSSDNTGWWISSASVPLLPDHVAYSVVFLRLLMGFILFISTSALLAGALQAAHHFFLPAISPVILNIFFITGLYVCQKLALLPSMLCLFIMAGGIFQVILHAIVYKNLGFSVERPNKQTWIDLKHVWKKFVPCLISMSILEIYLFIDTSLASFLPAGSVAVIHYANRFMQIPLSVVATALSTILLPYFSQIGTYAPRRLGFYIFEASKLLTWVLVPVAFTIGFVSHTIFSTLFLSAKFTAWHVDQAAGVLIASLYGVCFFSLNKIILNVFYGLHDTKTPMYISAICVFLNGILSYIFMFYWQAYGIALGTTVAGIIQTCLLLFFLKKIYKLRLYGEAYMRFLSHFFIQAVMFGALFYTAFYAIQYIIALFFGVNHTFFVNTLGFWLWYIPLVGLFYIGWYKTRSYFGIVIRFLEQ